MDKDMDDSALLLKLSPKTFYDPKFLPEDTSLALFKELDVLPGWRTNTYQGLKLNRQTIVFANDEIVASQTTPDNVYPIPPIWGKGVEILPWPVELLKLKLQIEQATGVNYTIALGNRYVKAKDAIAFHSDNEEFGNTQSIASISLGVPRTFTFKSKHIVEHDVPPEKKTLILENGSLLFMGENCQENYTHGMRKEKIVEMKTEAAPFGKTRINVTFRVWNYSANK